MASLKCKVGKIVIVGDSGVGKTTLLRTYRTSGLEYNEKYLMTMGVVPSVTEIKISDDCDAVKFLFYDTTGSDVYHGILPKYWMAPDFALIVFDVSSTSSFANLNHWIELIKNVSWNNNETKNQPTAAVFANKVDLNERRVIKADIGEEFANQSKIKYFEGSAKTNEGVCEVFQWFAHKWLSVCDKY